MTRPQHDQPPDDVETQRLVSGARRDLRAGFVDLFDRLAPSLYAWARLHIHAPLRPRLEPEDLLQEVACRAYDAFSEFDSQRSDFRAWMFGIARNVLREAFRRLGRGASRGGEQPLPTSDGLAIPDSATNISRRVARHETLASFVASVEALPPDEQRLLNYRGLQGLPHAEVAKLLGLNEETARKRWNRLRERLAAEQLPADLMVA